jgi:hypothetical protein
VGTLQNTLLSMNACAVVCIVAMLCVGLVEARYRSFATAAVVDAVSAEVLELQAKLRPSHARFLAELVSVLSPRSKVRRAEWGRPAGPTRRVLTGYARGTHGYAWPAPGYSASTNHGTGPVSPRSRARRVPAGLARVRRRRRHGSRSKCGSAHSKCGSALPSPLRLARHARTCPRGQRASQAG